MESIWSVQRFLCKRIYLCAIIKKVSQSSCLNRTACGFWPMGLFAKEQLKIRRTVSIVWWTLVERKKQLINMYVRIYEIYNTLVRIFTGIEAIFYWFSIFVHVYGHNQGDKVDVDRYNIFLKETLGSDPGQVSRFDFKSDFLHTGLLWYKCLGRHSIRQFPRFCKFYCQLLTLDWVLCFSFTQNDASV